MAKLRRGKRDGTANTSDAIDDATDGLTDITTDGDPNPYAAADAPTEMLPATFEAPTGDPSELAPSADGGARFDGRSRRRQAALVVGAALLTGVGGFAIGRQVRSPADAAADRAAPTASRITTAVTRQPLESTLVLSGEIQFTDPAAIVLAGLVGVPTDEAQVLTRVPVVDTPILEGDIPFEVSGRPIFFLQGDLPMYRKLAIGMNGPDVAQLEAALSRLGFAPGTPEQAVDSIFDRATADALIAMYTASGYTVEGSTAEQAESVRLAQESVTAGEQALRDAQEALVTSSEGLPGSQALQLRQAVDAATVAVPVAQQQRNNDIAAAQQSIDDAVAIRARATAERDASTAALNAANQPGSVDPETGEPYSAAQRNELAARAAAASTALQDAERGLSSAQAAQPIIKANADASLKAAQNTLALAQAQLAEANKPANTTAAQQNVTAATTALDQAKQSLIDASTGAGPRLAPGEIVFLPTLPSAISSVDVKLGSQANQQLGMASTSDITVRAAVGRSDSAVIVPGAKVLIQLRDVDLEVPGTIVSIGTPAPVASTGGGDGNSNGEQQPPQTGDSSRLEVIVLPDDPTALKDYVYYGVKLRIAVAATSGDVLVVPVAALTVGADGNSRVVVEESPITETSEGTTRTVSVTVGLSANGLAEVAPVAGEQLAVGDRVVVGVE